MSVSKARTILASWDTINGFEFQQVELSGPGALRRAIKNGDIPDVPSLCIMLIRPKGQPPGALHWVNMLFGRGK